MSTQTSLKTEHKCQFFISPFQPRTVVLSKLVFIEIHQRKLVRVKYVKLIRNWDRGMRWGYPQQHSHSQSSCWLHCRSSQHCPYCSRIPWQRRLATCHSSALHKEEDEGRTGASRSSYDCVNFTKDQSEEESERSRRNRVKTGIRENLQL